MTLCDTAGTSVWSVILLFLSSIKFWLLTVEKVIHPFFYFFFFTKFCTTIFRQLRTCTCVVNVNYCVLGLSQRSTNMFCGIFYLAALLLLDGKTEKLFHNKRHFSFKYIKSTNTGDVLTWLGLHAHNSFIFGYSGFHRFHFNAVSVNLLQTQHVTPHTQVLMQQIRHLPFLGRWTSHHVPSPTMDTNMTDFMWVCKRVFHISFVTTFGCDLQEKMRVHIHSVHIWTEWMCTFL